MESKQQKRAEDLIQKYQTQVSLGDLSTQAPTEKRALARSGDPGERTDQAVEPPGQTMEIETGPDLKHEASGLEQGRVQQPEK